MVNIRRPYLIVPKLIEQPTWGGDYIEKIKGLSSDQTEGKHLIGQSYELFSETELVLPDKSENGLKLTELVAVSPKEVLGEKVFDKYGKMPLLIKLTQAKGNSFQLHIRPGVKHERWVPKSESWYYFEKGKLTCGIKKGISMVDYKNACVEIDKYMEELSRGVINGNMAVEEAREKAGIFIKNIDPWQFVQTMRANEGDVFDLSRGGLHHSWEEDPELPAGNILYEVQEDRMDPVSTIRAFDQGKINDNGTIRKIDIEDYFEQLDANQELNTWGFAATKTSEINVFTTTDYAMDVMEIEEISQQKTGESFNHYYVKTGRIIIEGGDGGVELGEGWSCFVPKIVDNILIKPVSKKAVVLKTYVPTTD